MNTHLKTLAAGLVALLAALQPATSRADFAYGVTYFDNQLISVDTTTGVGSVIGSLSTPMSPFGLAAVGNNLYTFDSTADVIRQISTTTGATQASINIGLSPGALLGQGGLAFQSSTVGFLTSALNPTDFSNVNNLYRFDISTGQSTFIAHTAFAMEALAFGKGGVLYGLGKADGRGGDGNLYTVNTTTGAMSLVGNVGVAVGSPTGGLAFGANGMLYATLDDTLYTLNTSTGLATLVNSDPTVNIGYSTISGLAFTAAAVPEPSSIILSGVFFAVAGGYGLVRRRKNAGSGDDAAGSDRPDPNP